MVKNDEKQSIHLFSTSKLPVGQATIWSQVKDKVKGSWTDMNMK